MTGDEELDAGWDDDTAEEPAAGTSALDAGADANEPDEEALDGGWDADDGSASPTSLLGEADPDLDDAWGDGEGVSGDAAAKWQPYRKKRRPKKGGRASRTVTDGDIPLQAPKPASAGVKALRKAQRGERGKRGAQNKRTAREVERRRAREAARPEPAQRVKKKRAKTRPSIEASQDSAAALERNERARPAKKPGFEPTKKSARKVSKKGAVSRDNAAEEPRSPLPAEQPADRGRNLLILVGALVLVALLAWLLMGSR